MTEGGSTVHNHLIHSRSMKLVRPITICLTDTYKDYDSQDTSAEVGLGTNTKKIKYMFISHQHNA